MHFFSLLPNVQNKSIDINRDQILDLHEVKCWLTPSQKDYNYDEVDHIFAMFDIDRDWDLNQEEIGSAFLSLIHLLPQSAWTNMSLAAQPDPIIFDDSFGEEPVVGIDNSSHEYKFLPSLLTDRKHDTQFCDRRLPFVIPLPQVCDIPRVHTR